MFKRLHHLSNTTQHIFSLLLSLAGMGAAAVISAVYYNITDGNTAIVSLIFIFFVILVSRITTGYLYGIACSLFFVVWFNYAYTYPDSSLNFTLSGYPVTFAGMAAVTILISILTSYPANQSKLAAEREKQLAEAEAEKMRANLLRAISHDLRTPLTGIIGNSIVYLENQEMLNEKEKSNIVTNIHEDATWLINMAENLLTITRIRDNDMTINTNVESVEEVIGESLQRMEKRHPNCEFQVKFPDDFIMLPMDAVLIEQVIINLLENALLYSDSTPVDLIVEDEPGYVSFTVRDYGQGIPEDMLDRLFEGTAYTAPHAADAQKGAGIGLVICKTIITAHHGTIIGRNHGNGAEFIFTLPKTEEAIV